MRDTGFADASLVRLTLRAIGLKVAVRQARASVEALANLLDQHGQPLAGQNASLRKQGIGLTGSDQQRGVDGGAVGGAERDALREDELLQGVKLVAQLLDRVEVGIRHGLFSCAGAEEATRAADAAHRICGGAE